MTFLSRYYYDYFFQHTICLLFVFIFEPFQPAAPQNEIERTLRWYTTKKLTSFKFSITLPTTDFRTIYQRSKKLQLSMKKRLITIDEERGPVFSVISTG